MRDIIEINQLGKKYPIRIRKGYLSLRESITHPFRNRSISKSSKTDFWALEDINLKIQAGERLGIIGKNGAGKSTLLKILSRIAWPTTGSVTVRGKLCSLLEVGTGFHPELSGRENIYLNGAILGLKTREIDKQFDSIVEFSGVEMFLDTPLKNFSTGMQLRLAFAVAAHLEPEILIIDEVLAVGDMDFQNKCLQKIQQISNEDGRTIIVVSHNMSHISSICSKVILLDHGKLIESGSANGVISSYISKIEQKSANHVWENDHRPGNDIVRLDSIRIIDETYATCLNIKVTEKIGIEMNYEVLKENQILWLGHNIFNQFSINVFDTHNVQTEYYSRPHPVGKFTSVVWIPANLLNIGAYYIGSAIFNHLQNVVHFHEKDVLLFKVYESAEEVTARGSTGGDFPGVIRPLLEWSIQKI